MTGRVEKRWCTVKTRERASGGRLDGPAFALGAARLGGIVRGELDVARDATGRLVPELLAVRRANAVVLRASASPEEQNALLKLASDHLQLGPVLGCSRPDVEPVEHLRAEPEQTPRRRTLRDETMTPVT